jgi:hypothetical protein
VRKQNFKKLKPCNNNHQLKIRSQGKEDKQGFIDTEHEQGIWTKGEEEETLIYKKPPKKRTTP